MLFSSSLSYLTVFSKLTMRITGWEYDCLLKVTGGLFRKRNIATFSQISWHPGNAYIMCVTCGFVPSVQKSDSRYFPLSHYNVYRGQRRRHCTNKPEENKCRYFFALLLQRFYRRKDDNRRQPSRHCTDNII